MDKTKHPKARAHDVRRNLTVEERRLEVARMYVKGYSQRAIAEVYGVTQPIICDDLKVIREQWRKRATEELSEQIVNELMRIDALEEAAWTEWARSREDHESILARSEVAPQKVAPPPKSKDGKRTPDGYTHGAPAPMVTLKRVEEKRTTGRLGHEPYLARVAWCIEMRCKLFGLIKTQKPDDERATVLDFDALIGMAPRRVEAVDDIETEIERAALPATPTRS